MPQHAWFSKTTRFFARNPLAGTGKTLAQKYWYFPGFMKPLFQNMLGHDGADHQRLRGLVDQAFGRTSIEELRPRLEKIADGLLDNVHESPPLSMLDDIMAPRSWDIRESADKGRNSLDIVATYARPLPLMAICDLLGIPDEERAKVARWISPLSGPTSTWGMLRGFPGLWRIMRYFRADFERVRRSPRSGLITDLVAAEEEGDRLTDDELLAMVVTLFIAGHETTVHLITMGIYGLLTHPKALTALRDRPDELPLLVEEIMRHYSPVMMTKPHFVQQDTVFGGISLKKGDQVAALLIAANYDIARFERPDELIPDRRPNAHLGFGHGPHVCLGMQLARAEAQIALTRLFTRFPNLQLANPHEPPDYVTRVGIRGLKQLELRLV